jgi:hypothetical protein
MTTPILETNRAIDWVRVHGITLIAQPALLTKRGFHPMAAHTIPFIFNCHTLVIDANSANAKPHWDFAFSLEQLIDVPAIGLSQSAKIAVKLGLNLIRFPNIDGIYQLRARFPKWHKDMHMQFYQYIGIDSDLLTTASESILLLRETNRKLNDIDAWGNSK